MDKAFHLLNLSKYIIFLTLYLVPDILYTSVHQKQFECVRPSFKWRPDPAIHCQCSIDNASWFVACPANCVACTLGDTAAECTQCEENRRVDDGNCVCK